MMRDKLSRREDRALLRALQELVLTQYPNPERKDCPGTVVLESIATKRISMLDPAHDHVATCSPCFKELTDMRLRLQRRNVLIWSMAGAGTAALILAVALTYFGSGGVNAPVGQETVQSEAPSETPPPVDAPGGVTPQPSIPATVPEQAVVETALLDLRNASASRTAESATPGPNAQPIEIPRGLLALTVQLPIGSDAGPYEVEIRDSNQQPIQRAKGTAAIENGITKLTINIDTRSIPSGAYDFAWRLADFSWRHYPILIR